MGVRLDLPAELVAIHFRHQDVADDHQRLALTYEGEGFAAVCGDGSAIVMLLENMLQLQRLGGTVLDDEDFNRSVFKLSRALLGLSLVS